jgi:hypothetical protein
MNSLKWINETQKVLTISIWFKSIVLKVLLFYKKWQLLRFLIKVIFLSFCQYSGQLMELFANTKKYNTMYTICAQFHRLDIN